MPLEHNLWNSLKSRLEAEAVFYQRIETGTANGVPDLWIGRKKKSAWVELKAVIHYPVRNTTPVFGDQHGLRPEQVAWIFRATRKLVNVKILAAVGAGHNKDLYCVPGELCQKFNKMTKEELQEYKVSGGIAAVPALLLHRARMRPQAPTAPVG